MSEFLLLARGLLDVAVDVLSQVAKKAATLLSVRIAK